LEALRAHVDAVVPGIEAASRGSLGALANDVESKFTSVDSFVMDLYKKTEAAFSAANQRTEALALMVETRFTSADANAGVLQVAMTGMTTRMDGVVDFLKARDAQHAARETAAVPLARCAPPVGAIAAAANAAHTDLASTAGGSGWRDDQSTSTRRAPKRGIFGGELSDDSDSGDDKSSTVATRKRDGNAVPAGVGKGVTFEDKQVWLHTPTTWRRLLGAVAPDARAATVFELKQSYQKVVMDGLDAREAKIAKTYFTRVLASLEGPPASDAAKKAEHELRTTVTRWAAPSVFGSAAAAAPVLAQITQREVLPPDIWYAVATTLRRGGAAHNDHFGPGPGVAARETAAVAASVSATHVGDRAAVVPGLTGMMAKVRGAPGTGMSAAEKKKIRESIKAATRALDTMPTL
jgi:hypothetical protein